MPFPLLGDVMIPRALFEALKREGYDAELAVDIAPSLVMDDEALLEFATQQGRVLFTCNYADPRHNFIDIDARWQQEGRSHAGILLCPKPRLDHRLWEVRDRLRELLERYSPDDMRNLLMWLP
jgi:hypothetical protein